MNEFYATRSNWLCVTDSDDFSNMCEKWDVTCLNSGGKYAIWSSYSLEQIVEFKNASIPDLIKDIKKLMTGKNQVCLLMEVRFETTSADIAACIVMFSNILKSKVTKYSTHILNFEEMARSKAFEIFGVIPEPITGKNKENNHASTKWTS